MKKGFYYGVEASEYGKESGYVDYGTLQEIVRGIPGTNIVEKTEGVIGNWELISGDMFYYSDGIFICDGSRKAGMIYRSLLLSFR